MSLLSYKDISENDIFKLLDNTYRIKKGKLKADFSNKTLLTLFIGLDPRAKVSFESAMLKNNGKVTSFSHNNDYHENIQNIIYSCQDYCDLIVARTDVSEEFKKVNKARVPIINAGDGFNENPSQNLSDLFDIYEYFNKDLESKTILFIGNILTSNNFNGLSYILKKYFKMNVKFMVDNTQINNVKRKLDIDDYQLIFEKDIGSYLKDADVLYFSNTLKYTFKEDYLPALKENCLIMHPSPIGKELSSLVLEDKRFIGFNKINDLCLKQALIDYLL